MSQFSILYECDDDDSAPTSNIQRKVIKKLREIGELEKKPHCELNSEQCKKISEKHKWERVLKPTMKTNNTYNDACDIERKKKQHKKTEKRKRERKQREEKQCEREEKRRQERQERLLQERLLQERLLQERLLQERLLQERSAYFAIQMEIRDNFNELYGIHKNKKTVVRLLLLQYHPDKNLDNPEDAEIRFKMFTQMYSI